MPPWACCPLPLHRQGGRCPDAAGLCGARGAGRGLCTQEAQPPGSHRHSVSSRAPSEPARLAHPSLEQTTRLPEAELCRHRQQARDGSLSYAPVGSNAKCCSEGSHVFSDGWHQGLVRKPRAVGAALGAGREACRLPHSSPRGQGHTARVPAPGKPGHYLPKTLLVRPQSFPGRLFKLGASCRVPSPLRVGPFFPIQVT